MSVKVYVKSTLSTALTVSRHTLDIRLDSLDIEFPRLGHSYVSRYVKVSIDSLDSLDNHSLEYRQLDSSSTELDSLDSLDKPRHSFDILDTVFP